ncbi:MULTISPECIES: hypothetical protein [unclassified Mycobacterium]|uniref:hypothetical protein n=1 Tax=unclassified Mycobacterium TaxID=2642494 RepID=UPI000993143B|nr:MULTISPECIES: hypothetical protein [unclassified Mycobacterium]
MIKVLHGLRDKLVSLHREIERELGQKPTGLAARELLDALDAQLRTITDVIPADAPMTTSMLMNDSEDWIRVSVFVETALRDLSRLIQECGNIVHERKQPFLRLIRRIESEGYEVDGTRYTQVSDGHDWSVDELDSPAVRVQLDAEQIARAEQAAQYQQRLERMDAAIQEIEFEYAERIRKLPKAVSPPPAVGNQISSPE